MTALLARKQNRGERPANMSKKQTQSPFHKSQPAPSKPRLYRCHNTPCNTDTWSVDGCSSAKPDHCPYCGSGAIELVEQEGKRKQKKGG